MFFHLIESLPQINYCSFVVIKVFQWFIGYQKGISTNPLKKPIEDPSIPQDRE